MSPWLEESIGASQLIHFTLLRDQNKFKGITLIALFSNDPERWKQPFSFCFRESQVRESVMCESSTKMCDWAWEKDLSTNAVSLFSKEEKETWGSSPFQRSLCFIASRELCSSVEKIGGEMTLEYWIYSYLSNKLLNLFKNLSTLLVSPELILFFPHKKFVGDSKPSHHPNCHFLNDFTTSQCLSVLRLLSFLNAQYRNFFFSHFTLWHLMPYISAWGDPNFTIIYCTIRLQCRRHRFYPWAWKIPWRRKWQPTPVFLPGKSHGQRSQVGYSPWGPKRVRHGLATKQLYYQNSELSYMKWWDLPLAMICMWVFKG